MEVISLGHAGLMVKGEGITLLMDPWFSPEGNFQASWFQYPDNSHLLTNNELYKPTAIAISHEHLDHCDPWFLSRVDSSVPVIIPKYPSPVLKEKILLGGNRPIIEVPEWEVYKLSETFSLFFVSEPPMNHDSAIILKVGDKTMLNMNDARLFPMQLKDIRQKVGGVVDYFGFQGAGASWFPMVYNFDEEKMQKLRQLKRVSKFVYCAKIMKIVQPVVGMAFAGPPAFLDPELFIHNREMTDGIFPDQQQVLDYLAKKGFENTILMLPGDKWDANIQEQTKDDHWKDFSFSNREYYLKEYQKTRLQHIANVYERNPVPEKSLWDDFKDYFEKLLKMNQYFNDNINMKVGFEITGNGGGNWHVDFRKESQGVGQGIEDCGYNYKFESRWLAPVLREEVPWEDFFLTLRFTCKRNPDMYNDHLLGLLKFANVEALQQVEKFETQPKSEEMIKIHSEGKTYMISRYCPHAGNDMLETGEVVPGGKFRCLAHHYDFDLSTGECLTSNCDHLKVVEVTDEG